MPFSLKEPHNVLDYYKLDWRKCQNIKIRRLPDQSGNRQIEIRQLPDWSGCCLIEIRQLPKRSGNLHGKIRQLPD